MSTHHRLKEHAHMRLRTTLLATLLSLGSLFGVVCVAHADVIPDCEEGERFEGYPTQPGAMHHGGGRCVDDRAASSGCSASVGRYGGAMWGTLLVLAATLALRRRSPR